MPLQLSVNLRPVRIGPGPWDSGWAGKSAASSAASSIPSGNGRDKPASAARLAYLLTVLTAMPRAAAISRWLRPRPYFRRATSGVLRADNLGCAGFFLLSSGDLCEDGRPARCLRSSGAAARSLRGDRPASEPAMICSDSLIAFHRRNRSRTLCGVAWDCISSAIRSDIFSYRTHSPVSFRRKIAGIWADITRIASFQDQWK